MVVVEQYQCILALHEYGVHSCVLARDQPYRGGIGVQKRALPKVRVYAVNYAERLVR